jgi:DNA-directed RNA polymerase subunit RPC12/RpoP
VTRLQIKTGSGRHATKWINPPKKLDGSAATGIMAGGKNLMARHKFECSTCGQRLECDEQYSGREIVCPACQGRTRVPPVPGQAAPSPQKSGMTFVPEAWQKPVVAKIPPAAKKKSGMTHVPENWSKPPPPE